MPIVHSPNTNYINNQVMLKEMVLYRKSCLLAKREHQPRPLLNDYLGSCFLQIALHLSRKPCFVGYTFREEMMSDAVENCVQYASNFNPLKSKNPFAYFTQIIYYAFLRRIAREKKMLYVKYKATEESGLLDTMRGLVTDASAVHHPVNLYENITHFIHEYEVKRAERLVHEKKQKTKSKKVKKKINPKTTRRTLFSESI